MKIADVDTPGLLLDLDRVERNLDKMAEMFRTSAVKLRPHAKTHKTAAIARMQLERGAVGICCAKLGEAEALVNGGIQDILITTEIVGETKIHRLIALATRAKLIVVVDDAVAAAAISDAASASGLRIDVLVDVDVGQHRTGVASGLSAVVLGKAVAAMDGLHLRGLQGYDGHTQQILSREERRAANAESLDRLRSTARLFEAAGLSTEIVTTGGTGTSEFARGLDVITDVQPGSYVMMDAPYASVEGLAFERALTVLATVISVRENWVVVDAGFKALSNDGGIPIVLDAEATFAHAGDEHGKLQFGSGPAGLDLGAKVQIVPSHCDTTVNLHSEFVVHRNGVVVERWPIVARGRSD